MKPWVLRAQSLAAACAVALGVSIALADNASNQQDADGFHVTPEVLSPSGSSSTASSASTLGLEYNFQKTLPLPYSVPYRLTSCGVGCNGVLGLTGQLSGSGKVAADSKVDVGDLIDVSGVFGSEYYYFGQVPLPGQPPTTSLTGDSTATLKASFEAGQRLSTRQYTYGITSSDTLAPVGGPHWVSHISWPTFLLEFARINPTNDAARKAVDQTLSDYNRFHFRLSGGIKVGSFDGRVLRVDVKYDHWQEISPSKAIVAADLNAQTYRAYSFVFVGRGSTPDWLITYANGNVPTDQSASKVWQLGWQWNFDGNGNAK